MLTSDSNSSSSEASNTPVTREVRVPPGDVGLVIGKGGATIRRLENMTGITSVNLDRRTSLLHIHGQHGAVEQMVGRVREILDLKKPQWSICRRKCVIPVPEGAAGFVIGSGGAAIRELRSVAGINYVCFDDETQSLWVAGDDNAGLDEVDRIVQERITVLLRLQKTDAELEEMDTEER